MTTPPRPTRPRPTTRQRLRYRFDNTIARGSSGLIGWLALLTLLLVVVAGLVLYAGGIRDANDTKDLSIVEGAWRSLMRTLDSGTMGGDEGWPYRVVGLLVTLGGLFIVATLIGLITSAIDQKLEELRKGRSPVIEEGHTLVLGWSEKLHTIVSELVIANENKRDSCVVVMAPRDKVEMEDELRARLEGGTGNTRIVCRSGDPTDPGDLDLVNPMGAKSVIVLAPESDESPDAHVVKVVLGLMSFDREFVHLEVAAELTRRSSADALEQATGGRMRTVISTELIARITAQVCRQSGLSLVYQELLDFDGDEVYFADVPELHGRTYGEAIASFDDSCVIGLRDSEGRVVLNPAMSTRIEPGDRVVAISEDDDTIRFAGGQEWEPSGPAEVVPAERNVEHTLVVGWNAMAATVLGELDQYVAPGSHCDVHVDPALATVHEDQLRRRMRNLDVHVFEAPDDGIGDIVAALAAHDYDQVVLLCYRDALPVAEADARVLLALLQIRRALEPGHRNEHVSIVTELLDVRAVQLAQVANPDDFVVSERLTSLVLAQLSENPELEAVFDDLFDAEGSEVNLVPIDRYAQPGTQTTFLELVRAARDQGQTAIGIRSPGGSAGDGLGGGVVVNPRKSTPITPLAGDHLIVVCAS